MYVKLIYIVLFWYNIGNVAGLVLAGSADFKTELFQSDLFDPRLCKQVIKTLDVSYGKMTCIQ